MKGTINKARRELLVYAPNKKNVHAKLILVRYVGTDAGSPGGLRVIILTANNLGVGVNSLEDNRRIQVIFHQDFLCMKDKGAAPPTSSFGRRLGALMEALCEGAGARVHAHRRGLLQGVAFNNPRGEIITCFPGAGQTSGERCVCQPGRGHAVWAGCVTPRAAGRAAGGA